LSGCSTTRTISLNDPEITVSDVSDVVKLPPIDRALMTPCFFDLMPSEVDPLLTDNIIETLIKVNADNFAKVQTCYLRQYDLIQELIRREDFDDNVGVHVEPTDTQDTDSDACNPPDDTCGTLPVVGHPDG